jgi:tRNA(Ile)-lysidine synthase
MLTKLAPLIPKNSRLIVGFSGGPDSTFLLHILIQLQQSHNLTIIAAHVNHQWRDNAYQDGTWCKNFCIQNDITFEYGAADTICLSTKYNGSKEEHGRQLRRTFFNQLMQKYQADHIVLGHHADDQIETFFIRLMRGASLTGVAGIRMHDGIFFRPLLNIKKSEILDYLKSNTINFLTDHTNDDTTFLRNNIRHTLIAQCENIDSRFKANTLKLINQLQQADQFIDGHCKQLITQLQTPSGFSLDLFFAQHPWLQQKILLELLIMHHAAFTPSNALLQEIMRFLQTATQPTHQISANLLLCKKDNCFYFKSL